jgi:hypothetical protein
MAALINLPTAPVEAKALKLSCSYPLIANPGGVFKDQSLALIFSIDETGKHATVTGAQGAHAVEVFTSPNGMTFIDRQKSGAVQVTTIDSAGKSVHSRHVILGGALIPSQSYGKCVAE